MDIEPALTAEEWSQLAKYFADGHIESAVYHACCEFTFVDIAIDVNSPVPAMAIMNASLPDDDPRKITREMVETLRAVAEGEYNGQGTGADLLDIAAKLAALLPP